MLLPQPAISAIALSIAAAIAFRFQSFICLYPSVVIEASILFAVCDGGVNPE
ncbi:hypothetical protein ANK1_0268 [plant metagenome]|uniref:Uncharacterized protein n=1 Tax=plant metagenome TaxID=1297885 RepID=A0A484SU94_9ZZZZ